MHAYAMGWMWLWWLLPLLLVILVYVVMSRNTGNDTKRAQDILDERLAKGDIDLESYKKLKDELSKGT